MPDKHKNVPIMLTWQNTQDVFCTFKSQRILLKKLSRKTCKKTIFWTKGTDKHSTLFLTKAE